MTEIKLPTLAEGASLRLTDPRMQNDATFTTKKGRPVDCVCVDHSIVETTKGTPAVRLLFVVLAGGVNEGDQDVTGQNIVTDKYLSPGAEPYTYADLRLMGWNVEEGKELDGLVEIANGDVKKSGLGLKVVRIDIGFDDKARFTPVPIRVKGISQPSVKLTGDEVRKKMAGAVAAIQASKAGRPKFDNSGAAGGGTQPRNPTSPPPAAGGSIKADEKAPWDL